MYKTYVIKIKSNQMKIKFKKVEQKKMENKMENGKFHALFLKN